MNFKPYRLSLASLSCLLLQLYAR